MGKRFAIVIGVAATGVMALGAQTAAAAPDVVKYNTKLSFTWDNPHGGTALFHGGGGGVQSKVRKCERGRRVVLFKQRPGADRKFAATESNGHGNFGVVPPKRTLLRGDRIYAEVKREVRNGGDVCRVDRSKTRTFPTHP